MPIPSVQHKVPFTVYVPTGLPMAYRKMWWLALEQVIARHDRISLVIDRSERHSTPTSTTSTTCRFSRD